MSTQTAKKLASFPADEQRDVMIEQVENDDRIELADADIDAMIHHYIETGEYTLIEKRTEGLDLQRQVKKTTDGEIRVEQMKGVNAYLAQITGPDCVYGAERYFIDGDESQLSRARKGQIVYNVADLDNGVYEAQSTWRSMRRHRVYFVLRAGEIEVLDNLDQALAAAKVMDY